MKKVCVRLVMLALLVLTVHAGFSQAAEFPSRFKVLKSQDLRISHSKTTNLLFGFAIKSVDLGSGEVLAQIAKGAENILQVKAARQNFSPTNLSVITADGRFFSFMLDYVEDPVVLNLSFADEEAKSDRAVLQQVLLDEAALDQIGKKVAAEANFLHRSVGKQGIRLSLKGLYICKKTMWFAMRIGNNSLIDYAPENIRFFIRDKKRSKRTAVQEREITPIFMADRSDVLGGESNQLIMGFPAFTIPSDQQLVIRMAEKGGGRNLDLVLPPRTILKARLLPE
ncbi:MAG: conjugative transposon protein TraN [Sphingobacteriales bacterium]|nr:conjugative transposon protein TraN [Sphingobacteriales bacterium]OJW02002.1 MAG: conjugative transposon protein TraN [Sphingobacteriales bacterium 44-61]